ncbi:hypothetical protein SDRG_03267 [Saprolegnia diclina VS20]|uniref:CAP-Gly domain-containing protein n=1 Tax=Saprolegnia diclina (strain VS20) TaxID=1156394 RepID=T0QLX8_SAPDV|nr:hypothetical protein SDRG_03267 [Saprolegnia diclina VS20]EQC39059.1 hypothetical protein SDRG_03267 [Saprolegnia diclina VS20]|eukprot:XP_008607120.1 hypothetical protein SDRG_03267 [Saprolegnia diclina VS20]
MELGSRVLVVGGKTGVVRFLGTTEFAQGDWVGVELDAPEGKNDGEINGVRYFQCEPNFGLFAKKSQVRLARGGSTPPTHGTTTSTSSSATSRLLQMREKRSSTTSLTPPAAPAPAKKTSPRLPTDRPLTRRSSLTVPSSPSRRAAAPAPLSLPPSPTESTRSTRSIRSIDEHEALEHAHDKIENLLHDLELKNERIASLQAELLEAQKAPTPAPAASTSVLDARAEYDEKVRELRDEGIALAAKMRKDFEIKVTKLEKTIEDKEASFQAALDKQLHELQAATSELVALRNRNAQFTASEQARTDEVAQAQAKASAAARKIETLNAQLADLHDTVEMLTLEKETLAMDKEIAEERLEDAEMEVEKLTLAAEIAGDSSHMPLDVHSSSVHEENAKLRTAIKALHDRYADEKMELTKSFKEASRQANELASYRDEVEVVSAKMAKVAHENDELKEMLDVASAYEAMVEALTEKNLSLGERVADLEASVASLEALKDMSEEMEHQHDLLEKDLRSELLTLRTKVTELHERLASAQANVDDKERTVHRFRELAHRNREEMSALREKLRLEAGELESMKDTTHAVLSQTLSLRQALATARASTVEAARAKVAAESARVEATWLRSLLPSSVFTEADDRSLKVRLLLSRLHGNVDVVLNHVLKNVSSLTSDVLGNPLEKARLAYEWALGVRLLHVRLAIAHAQQSLHTAGDTAFQALLVQLDGPSTHQLDVALDGVLVSLGVDGGLSGGSDAQPSSSDRLLSVAAEWSALFPLTQVTQASLIKLQAQAHASILSLHCAIAFLHDDLPLELRGAVWNLALQVARRAELDLGGDASSGDDDDAGEHQHVLATVVGGDVLGHLQAYALESGELTTETQLQSFKERLSVLYKAVAKGALTDACVLVPSPVPPARRQPTWELRAEMVRTELASASTLLTSLEETTDVCHTLQARLKELEKTESQSRVIVQKLEHDVTRLSDAVANETSVTSKLQSQLTHERAQFEQMLSEQNKERAALESAHRQLRKQLRRNSDLPSTPTTTKEATSTAASSSSTVSSSQVRALEAALAEMHVSMQRLRQETALERLQAAIAPLPPVRLPSKLAACAENVRRVESQVLAMASLPSLYVVGGATAMTSPATSSIVPLAKTIETLRAEIASTAATEGFGADVIAAVHANEVAFSGRSVDSVHISAIDVPARVGRLTFPGPHGKCNPVKVVLSSSELHTLSRALLC